MVLLMGMKCFLLLRFNKLWCIWLGLWEQVCPRRGGPMIRKRGSHGYYLREANIKVVGCQGSLECTNNLLEHNVKQAMSDSPRKYCSRRCWRFIGLSMLFFIISHAFKSNVDNFGCILMDGTQQPTTERKQTSHFRAQKIGGHALRGREEQWRRKRGGRGRKMLLAARRGGIWCT